MKKRSESFTPRLNTHLFIYNSDSNRLPGLKDYTAGTPAAIQVENCALSAITHTPVGMKKEWKRFVRDLAVPSRFLNRNEFFSEFGQCLTKFPVVLLQKETELEILVSAEELNRCRTLEDFVSLLEQQIRFVTEGFRITGQS
jgi:hypothetical protein